jgi:chromosome segregation ATPase
MRVEVLEVLVARQKQINAELEAIKSEVQEHEEAVEALYREGQPLADEAKSVSHELKIELGLIEGQTAPQQAG